MRASTKDLLKAAPFFPALTGNDWHDIERFCLDMSIQSPDSAVLLLEAARRHPISMIDALLNSLLDRKLPSAYK